MDITWTVWSSWKTRKHKVNNVLLKQAPDDGSKILQKRHETLRAEIKKRSNNLLEAVSAIWIYSTWFAALCDTHGDSISRSCWISRKCSDMTSKFQGFSITLWRRLRLNITQEIKMTQRRLKIDMCDRRDNENPQKPQLATNPCPACLWRIKINACSSSSHITNNHFFSKTRRRCASSAPIRGASCPSPWSDNSHMQSMELSGISPRGGAFAGIQDGGSMLLTLGDGSTFSLSSILSANPSQLIWKRVTRGLEAKIFLWSWDTKKKKSTWKVMMKNHEQRLRCFLHVSSKHLPSWTCM